MKKIALFLVFGYLLLFAALWQLPDGKFWLRFLDVGQGDSIFIESAEGHKILIDGGPRNKVLEELSELMPFWDKNIDLLVLSHPHADHMDGLVEVLKRYDVKAVLFTAAVYESSTYDEFIGELDEEEVFIAEADLDFSFGELFIDVIYPFKSIAGEEFENINNSSIAMKLFYDGRSVLLTGDLEEEIEKDLLRHGIDLRADIFKAGHHGSKSSSTWSFLQRVQPDVVVIQCGEDNKFGHPHAETLRNFARIGAEVWRNDLHGRVEFSW